MDLKHHLEHSLLRPNATREDIVRLCQEAMTHHFHAVCVNGAFTDIARAVLEESQVKVVSVVGFPFGAMDPDVKRYETEVAVDQGAEEIDMVTNLAWLIEGDHGRTLRELRDVVEAADERPVKVILETGYLNRNQTRRACEWVVESGAKFVKNGTGFGPTGATVEGVRDLRDMVGEDFGVKASGGIRDLETALAMIEAGANRIGTSASLDIVQELN